MVAWMLENKLNSAVDLLCQICCEKKQLLQLMCFAKYVGK